MGRRLGVLLLLAGLSACASSIPPSPPPPSSGAALQRQQVPFAEVPGWDADDQGAALAAFRQSCRKILALAPSAALGPAAVGGRAAEWQAVCRQAAVLPAGDDSAARAFFEGTFRAYALSDSGGSQGFFTGYYLPRVAGSRRAQPGYD
ncbi:MAG TPA: murein transglycosylase, partial [Verrucomicrobiae bacterium]|nr:murein transglycosylase [Verrucomicrobiae bacterium]